VGEVSPYLFFYYFLIVIGSPLRLILFFVVKKTKILTFHVFTLTPLEVPTKVQFRTCIFSTLASSPLCPRLPTLLIHQTHHKGNSTLIQCSSFCNISHVKVYLEWDLDFTWCRVQVHKKCHLH